MTGPEKLLVIAASDDERALYARSLARRFSAATILEERHAAAALMSAADDGIAAIVMHYNASPEASELLGALRRLKPATPIVALSGIDRQSRARAQGATEFVLAQSWAELGDVVQRLFASNR